MAGLTKKEVRQIAPSSPLTGFVIAVPSAILPTDTILEGLEKTEGTLTQQAVQIGTIQVGNNLFNYYNFR